MKITKSMKMAEVIQLNHMLIPVIHRFGINLGFGDKTVEDICLDQKTDLNFFLELVNAYHDSDYFPKEELQATQVHYIIDYLKKTHSSYLSESLTEIESLIESLLSEKNEDRKYITLIKNFFGGYRTEIEAHIKKEEEVVFPYVLAIEKVVMEQDLSEHNRHILKSYSINLFEEEHDDIEEKLLDLTTIMIKYLTPPKNINTYHKIIQLLLKLAKDINYHSRIEEKVLIPKVKYMERVIKNLS